MRVKTVARFIMLAGLLLIPRGAWAQSASAGAIAGVARDATGAVLPGVTVEAASPALIEKVRTVVTDGGGQYKIEELRPGTYVVTFTLAGFSTVKREGIELTTGFTATVNADMKVGSLQETITVSSASPVVDIQNVNTQNVLGREILDALPSGKAVPALAALTVGLSPTGTGGAGQDVGGNKGEQYAGLAMHGGDPNDGRFLYDGMRYNMTVTNGGGPSKHYFVDQNDVQEIVLLTSGIGADTDTSGVQVNVVPKSGGNRYSGNFLLTGVNDKFQSGNLTPELQARGLKTTASVKQIYDVGGGFGGPINKDKLWFYTAHRWWGSQENAPGNYYNATQGTVFYTPDFSRPGYTDYYERDHTLRLTWQATTKQKITISDSTEHNCNCHLFVDNGIRAPETAVDFTYFGVNLAQATWSYTVSNRLLFQAGATYLHNLTNPRVQPEVHPTDIPYINLSTNYNYNAPGAGISTAAAGPGVDYGQRNERFSMSYITGSHAFKAGLTALQGQQVLGLTDTQQEVYYQFLQPAGTLTPVPNSIVQWAGPIHSDSRIKMDLGLYAQDQWTLKRLTLNVGLRFDYFNGYVPSQTKPAGRFVPALSFLEIDNVPNFTDLDPRVGAAYDLFGNGKTALKVTFGRYVQSLGAGGSAVGPFLVNPTNAIVQSTTRTWNVPNPQLVNGNYIPNCDLNNFTANGDCGPINNSAFGTVHPNTTYANDVMTGFGKRVDNWDTSVSVQQELRPGMAVNVGFFRTSWGNLIQLANLAATPANYDPYCITAPVDSRLPGGGGYPVCGLYDINPSKFGQVQNQVTQASHFGDPKQVYTGIDSVFTARFGHGGNLSGGMSTGHTRTQCVSPNYPTEQFCTVDPPFWHPQYKVAVVYPLPWGINASVNLQNLPGIPISAQYVATNAQVAPSLGRNLAACGQAAPCTATATNVVYGGPFSGSSSPPTFSGITAVSGIQLMAPFHTFEDRLNQVDARFAKVFKLGRTSVQGMFDIYNLFNASTVLFINSQYGPNWLKPSNILGGRLFKLGAQINF